MDLFQKLKQKLNIPPSLDKVGHFVVDDGIGLSILTTLLYQKHNEPLLLITSNLYKAQTLYNQLVSFIGKDNVDLLPSDELIRAETLAASKEMVSQRLYVLNKILTGKCRVIVSNLAAVTRYYPSPIMFSEKTISLKVGQSYDIEEIKKTLVKCGYLKVSKIDQSLQFATRGDILDIFSVNNDYPVRIEFYGDEIESIRYFDIGKQTSIEKINEITILPGNDFMLTNDEIIKAPKKIEAALLKDSEHLSASSYETLTANMNNYLDKIIEGQSDQTIYKLIPFLQDKHYSIFDYCKCQRVIFVDKDSIIESNNLLQNESLNYLMDLHEDSKIISRLEMYYDLNLLKNLDSCIYTTSIMTDLDDVSFDVKSIPYQASKPSDAANIISMFLNDDYKVVLCLSKNEHINTLQEQLIHLNIPYEQVADYELPSRQVGFSMLNMPCGFSSKEAKVAYLTSSELFNEKVRIARFDNRFKEATILRSYEDLEPGDYVVHEYQGIGQFESLETLESGGKHQDYLKIIYAANEILYVPLNQFHLVRKFSGKEGSVPRLSHLHSKDWENTKKRIKERINDLAQRLMNLYIERSKVEGYSFAPDDEFQTKFESNFPYDLTNDQLKAVEDIKKDMESTHPMDRLLCGDVGFGKTEVAFIAAFKAINSGKQVAMLCPTTLLARQHYELAQERFKGFDIKIATFSRLIPEKRQKEYIKDVAEGKAHFVIGTHRLLSKEITFKNLGLIIIDEEQRFGVEQKERLKELKNNVDVLTLSATPIPRTLQISLLGVRSMSLINTAPHERMPIQTYVSPFRIGVVKELIERELGRHGQVFYLHNNISTLYLCASRLQKILPGVNIGVAHGQMDRDEIEDVMLRFYNGDISVLVCTSIIENGIDVPNANMIIVEDSENYGLSQLYQIKGRVGRSNRIAYAYLFYTEHKELNEKAKKRLKAIQDFTELGSGYKIAKRDLMIRGAGDILGPEQAGFIDSIGLDMYIKLLNEAVREKMNEPEEEKITENTNLSLDAYIPKEFANDSEKIELYQDILSCPNIETLSAIKVKTRDIYGKLPPQVELLFVKRNIDILKENAYTDSIVETERTINIVLGKYYINIKGIGNILFEALIPYLQILKVSYSNNTFKLTINKRKNWIYDLEEILKSLVNVIKTHIIKETICD